MTLLPLWLRYRHQGSLDRLPGYRSHDINQRAKDALPTQNYQLVNWGGDYPVSSGATAHPMRKQSAYEQEAADALNPGIASLAGACYPHAAHPTYAKLPTW